MKPRANFLSLAVLALGFAGLALAVDITTMPTPELQERYENLTHELRCMTCMNNSIADSPVGLASDLRRDVKEMILAGKTDEQIRAYMVKRYGRVILFTPPVEGSSAWVWVVPAIALLAGVYFGVRIVRRRATLVDQDDSVVETEESPR
jgi:cytochrome c-type biogenesis protein CcmH